MLPVQSQSLLLHVYLEGGRLVSLAEAVARTSRVQARGGTHMKLSMARSRMHDAGAFLRMRLRHDGHVGNGFSSRASPKQGTQRRCSSAQMTRGGKATYLQRAQRRYSGKGVVKRAGSTPWVMVDEDEDEGEAGAGVRRGVR